MKKQGWPRRRELVIVTITKVNPYSVTVRLEEYDKEGMIHISELARRYIKKIKDFAKRGQTKAATIMNVDQEKKHITLSFKRVNKYDAEEKLKQFKREKKAEKILGIIAKKMKITLDQAYEKFGYKLKQEFGELFGAFQEASEEDGYDILVEKGIDKKLAKQIAEISQKQLEKKERALKLILELRCPSSDGIKRIRDILTDAQKKYKDIEISYISAPEYGLSTITKNPKQGEKLLRQAGEEIISETRTLDVSSGKTYGMRNKEELND